MPMDLPLSTLAIASAAGLAAGAAASLVAEHLPSALARSWRAEAREVLEIEASDDAAPDPHQGDPLHHVCPMCGGRQPLISSLPILSWALPGACVSDHPAGKAQRGQRAAIELLAVAITLTLVITHGASWATGAVIVASLVLLALTAIDVRTYLLPDALTLPLLWAGLLYQLAFQPDMLTAAVMGAALGYLLLWTIYWAFRLLRGKHAMGQGDFKLLAALGAWTGWQTLPAILLIAAVSGALLGLIAQLLVPTLRRHPIPFGPFLAVGGWIALIGGPEITAALQGLYFPGA